MIRKYYKLKFQLQEPLSIGSGDNQYSDKDIIRNSQGTPIVPATSLCGVYRNYLKDYVDDQRLKQYFGHVVLGTEQQSESQVAVYDAVLEGECHVSVRDHVGLDDYKVAIAGAKFDIEIVEPGACFVTYIELSGESEDIISPLMAAYIQGKLLVGHKSQRGYGRIKTRQNQIWERCFDLTNQQQLQEWLDFDMYAEDAFSDEHIYTDGVIDTQQDSDVVITLPLRQTGGISIRKYTTVLSDASVTQPDYMQMHYEKDGQKIPCIPGTSWAGAFRHQMKKLVTDESVRDAIMRDCFGINIQDHPMKRSKLRFSESQLQNGCWKKYTRNAIDRFTGGTIDGALYTEKYYYGGTTELTLSYPRNMTVEGVKWEKLIAAVIADLDQGFLAVGGLTAVGRGLFTVTACRCNGVEIYSENDKAVTAEEPKLYRALLRALEGEKQ